MKRLALFLDRDGVINVDKEYVHKIEDVEFLDGIFELIAHAKNLHYLVIIITNQSGIGRGIFSEEDFQKLNKWMLDQLKKNGASVDSVYYCPTHPTKGIGKYKKSDNRRKPNPGMIFEAENDYNINYSIKYFDDKEELALKSTNLKSLTDQQLSNIYEKYKPKGQTALLDALGNSINYFVSKKLLNNDSFDSCVIYVTTDGLENCSKNYNYQTISEMIKSAEENQNIKVLYLGANQDAIAEASKFGIPVNQAINYTEDSDNVAAVYRSAASVANRTRSTGETQFRKKTQTIS